MNDFGDKVRQAEREVKARAAKRTATPDNTTERKARKTTVEKRPTKPRKSTKKAPPEKVETKRKMPVGKRWKKGESGNPASQWQPGKSPNPGGRPKRTPITDAMRELLNEPYSGKDKRFKGKTYAQVLAIREMELAIANGDMRAAQEITDRVEGRVPQSMEHGGKGGGPIPIEFSSVEENEKRIAALLARATAVTSAEGGDNNGDGSGD